MDKKYIVVCDYYNKITKLCDPTTLEKAQDIMDDDYWEKYKKALSEDDLGNYGLRRNDAYIWSRDCNWKHCWQIIEV